MPDVTIKNVPDGAELDVKRMAIVAIERFIRQRDVKVPEPVVTKFQNDVDSICEANGVDKRFSEDEVEPEVVQ
jgi:hypothetical protein